MMVKGIGRYRCFGSSILETIASFSSSSDSWDTWLDSSERCLCVVVLIFVSVNYKNTVFFFKTLNDGHQHRTIGRPSTLKRSNSPLKKVPTIEAPIIGNRWRSHHRVPLPVTRCTSVSEAKGSECVWSTLHYNNTSVRLEEHSKNFWDEKVLSYNIIQNQPSLAVFVPKFLEMF